MEKGFTIAEVLITLTVIGVISALTIPNILQNTQNAESKTALKKIYSDLDQATKRLLIDNGGSLADVFTSADIFRNKYLQYLSYVKICNNSSTTWGIDGNGDYYMASNCWSRYNYNLNKNKGTDYWAINSQAVLSNGALLDFWHDSPGCEDNALIADDMCGVIEVDVNGLKAPNQNGKDIFLIYVAINRIVPAGADTDQWFKESCDANDMGDNGVGYGCAARVLQDKDY